MYIPFNVRSFNIAYCVLYSTLNLFIQLVQAIGVAVWRHDSYIFLRFFEKKQIHNGNRSFHSSSKFYGVIFSKSYICIVRFYQRFYSTV